MLGKGEDGKQALCLSDMGKEVNVRMSPGHSISLSIQKMECLIVGKYEWKSKLLIELDPGPKLKKQIKCLGRQHASQTTEFFFIMCKIGK